MSFGKGNKNLANQIKFEEQPIANIVTQKEFENYFLKAVIMNRTDICMAMIEQNLVEGRSTVVSVVNLNNKQLTQPFIESVNHINLERCGIREPV